MSRTKGSKNVDWDAIVAYLKAHAGRWILMPEMAAVPERTIETIRRRRRRALRIEDAVIRVRQRAALTMPDGKVTVTLALMYERKEPDAEDATAPSEPDAR